MVISRLMGGLGNQMFQYAVGRHLSSKLDTLLLLDTGFFELSGIHTQRSFELDVFDLKAGMAGADDLKAFQWFRRSGKWAAIQRRISHLRGIHYLVDRSGGFQPGVLAARGEVYLDGYWQSEKYFAPVADMIRRDLTFREPLHGRDMELSRRMRQGNSIAIHVRRGDYLTNPLAKAFYTSCGPEYYTRAVDIITGDGTDAELFLFSDDLEWVRNNLRTALPCTYVDHNTGDRPHLDMRLMSHCRHNIIANSSFSWWAAWLNTTPGKKVVAPREWFQKKPSTDIIPANWITL